ncbi:hypothetical protein GCM10010430_66670 [Kitasatospora cystarginea]|uniref:N-acetyltransferase domain-containing protein n=1 Tax=Kitasatospora cystarginea TaxID=58350 RepID=A0ABN3EV33_9ACTN
MLILSPQPRHAVFMPESVYSITITLSPTRRCSRRTRTTIAAERLILRLFTSGDVDDRYAYQSLPEVARYLYRPSLTREGCAESIAARACGTVWKTDGDVLLLAVCRADESAVVGEVVRTLASARARQADIGWVFNPQYADQGYATEAVRALASLAFGQLRDSRTRGSEAWHGEDCRLLLLPPMPATQSNQSDSQPLRRRLPTWRCQALLLRLGGNYRVHEVVVAHVEAAHVIRW